MDKVRKWNAHLRYRNFGIFQSYNFQSWDGIKKPDKRVKGIRIENVKLIWNTGTLQSFWSYKSQSWDEMKNPKKGSHEPEYHRVLGLKSLNIFILQVLILRLYVTHWGKMEKNKKWTIDVEYCNYEILLVLQVPILRLDETP